MDKIYALPEDDLRGEIYQRMLRLMGKNRGTWESAVAAVSLSGGLLSIVLGALDWAVVGLFAPAGALGSFLDVAGTILLVLPLPLLALGACCLDRLEKKARGAPAPCRAAARHATTGRSTAPGRAKNQEHPQLYLGSVRPVTAVRYTRGRPRAADDLQRADDRRARPRQGLRGTRRAV